MEALPASSSAAAPVAAPPAPIPEAGVAAAATPAPAPAPSGGSSSTSNIKDLLSDLNLTEVMFGILGTAALYYSIYYFRYQVGSLKSMNNEIQNKLDDLSIKVLDIQSAEKRNEQSASAGFDGVFF